MVSRSKESQHSGYGSRSLEKHPGKFRQHIRETDEGKIPGERLLLVDEDIYYDYRTIFQAILHFKIWDNTRYCRGFLIQT